MWWLTVSNVAECVSVALKPDWFGSRRMLMDRNWDGVQWACCQMATCQAFRYHVLCEMGNVGKVGEESMQSNSCTF